MKLILYLALLICFCACSPSEQRKAAQEQNDLTTKLIGKWQFKGETNTFLIFMASGKLILETDGRANIGTFSKASNMVDAVTCTFDDKAETAKVLFITSDELVITSLRAVAPLREHAKGEILQRLKK